MPGRKTKGKRKGKGLVGDVANFALSNIPGVSNVHNTL